MNWENNGYYSVYKHTLPNGQCYIGVTKKVPQRRWRNGLGYANQPNFYKYIKEYGWNNIKHEVVAMFDNRHDAWTYEHNLIHQNLDNCLNIKSTSTTENATKQREKYIKFKGDF